MTRREIAEQVVKITARELNLHAAAIKETDNFTMELGANSLKSIELVAEFEEDFGVSVFEGKIQETIDGKTVESNPNEVKTRDIHITDTTFRDGQQARPPYK